MIVVNASVAVKWFFAEENHEEARAVLRKTEPFVAPDLLVFETLNVRRREQRRSELTEEQFDRSAGALVGFMDELVPATQLIAASMKLVSVLDHDVYDCAYLACALRFQTIMATADARFARKAMQHGFQHNVMILAARDRT